MNASHTIEIQLPPGKDLSENDRQLLRTACEALVSMSCGSENDPPAQVRAMATEGWQVQSGLTWIARAERNREYEEAVGKTRGEALCQLCQLLGLHSVEGCP
jgi:hypothetical protein